MHSSRSCTANVAVRYSFVRKCTDFDQQPSHDEKIKQGLPTLQGRTGIDSVEFRRAMDGVLSFDPVVFAELICEISSRPPKANRWPYSTLNLHCQRLGRHCSRWIVTIR